MEKLVEEVKTNIPKLKRYSKVQQPKLGHDGYRSMPANIRTNDQSGIIKALGERLGASDLR